MGHPQRRRLRLEYDYGQPGYDFVTICTPSANGCLGLLQGRTYVPAPCKPAVSRDVGITAGIGWDPHRCLAILPDHAHFILVIPGGHIGPPLHEMMKGYKTQTTNAYIRAVRRGDAAFL